MQDILANTTPKNSQTQRFNTESSTYKNAILKSTPRLKIVSLELAKETEKRISQDQSKSFSHRNLKLEAEKGGNWITFEESQFLKKIEGKQTC